MPDCAFIFDLDGTLADTEPLAEEAWAQIVGRYGHTLDRDTLESLFGLRLTESSVLIRRRFNLDVSAEVLAKEREAAFLALAPGRVQAMPGAHEALEAVQRLGVPCALATSSGPARARLVLHELGLAPYFSLVVTGDQVPHGKPAPDIFLLTARLLGVAPEHCWVVEDAPNGVESAQRAGMRVVLVPNSMTEGLPFPPVDLKVRDLHELGERVREMAGK